MKISLSAHSHLEHQDYFTDSPDSIDSDRMCDMQVMIISLMQKEESVKTVQEEAESRVNIDEPDQQSRK